jgi:chromatin segregation and condensation protein Rec8/ScpA/Scc1 (kleisin family)
MTEEVINEEEITVAHPIEKDPIVQSMRRYGDTGPIARDDYISYNWAGLSIRPWTAEHEADLPLLLQDWGRFERNARRRERYAERKYGAWAREQVEELVRRLKQK